MKHLGIEVSVQNKPLLDPEFIPMGLFNRAFMKNAPVILLDEPTKELDAALCRQVCEMIKKIAEDKLVILVTHRDDDISLLDGELIDL